MFLDEHDDIAEEESSLAAFCSVVVEPTSVGVSADGSGADTKEAADLFEVQLRIEEPLDQFLASFFEVARVVV